MYETGPGYVLNHFVDLGPQATEPKSTPGKSRGTCPQGPDRGYKILVKREGETNPWHTLLEIFSLYLTLDTLSITPLPDNPAVREPQPESYFTSARAENSQVVILDSRTDGPFFSLWGLLTGKPTVRIAELPPDDCEQDILLPLPGGSNPLWHSDWTPQSCSLSTLTRTFSKRLLTHYSIPPPEPSNEIITVTIIDRKATRRLKDLHRFAENLQAKYDEQSISTSIRTVDFASLTFQEQLKVVRNTDVLVGVHGAGMVHTMFMTPDSASVEIFPPTLRYPVYRNLAKLNGVRYFSTHAKTVFSEELARRDWHSEDLEIGEEDFVEIVDLAIKSVYNRGTLNLDAT